MPHVVTPDTCCLIFKRDVSQTENTRTWTAEKLNVNQGFSGANGRHPFRVISDLVSVHDTARAIDACLKRFSAIEIDTEALLCYKIEDRLQSLGIRGLKPCFDIFGDAERVQHATAIGLDLKWKN